MRQSNDKKISHWLSWWQAHWSCLAKGPFASSAG